MRQFFPVTVLASTLMIAACNQDAAPESEDLSASAPLLEASVSDAMIPLEAVQSEAKIAPASVNAGSSGSATGGASGADNGAAADEATTPNAEGATNNVPTDGAAPAAPSPAPPAAPAQP